MPRSCRSPLLDTAWSYYLPSAPGTGEPEDMGYGEYLVRDALHSWHGPQRSGARATKTGWLRTLDGSSNYGWQADARPETMIANAKESARRLGVDTLDLLYSHCNDRRCRTKTRWAHSSSSWTKVWPKLSASPESTTRTSKPPTIFWEIVSWPSRTSSPRSTATLSTRWKPAKSSVWLFVCWSPLGGFLDPFNEHLFDRFREVAKIHDCSYQRVTLAWELAQYQYLFTIPSARNPQEIQDSFKSQRTEIVRQ